MKKAGFFTDRQGQHHCFLEEGSLFRTTAIDQLTLKRNHPHPAFRIPYITFPSGRDIREGTSKKPPERPCLSKIHRTFLTNKAGIPKRNVFRGLIQVQAKGPRVGRPLKASFRTRVEVFLQKHLLIWLWSPPVLLGRAGGLLGFGVHFLFSAVFFPILQFHFFKGRKIRLQR